MLKFTKIKNGDIFKTDYNPFVKNNEIAFSSSEKMAVIYGPNGSGKTSFSKVLAGDGGTEMVFTYNGVEYTEGSEIFHIIKDQNCRNVIEGETKDFFLGADIRREFELKDQLEKDRKDLLDKVMALLKTPLGINASNSSLIDLISNENLRKFVKDCANNKSKGKSYKNVDLVTLLHTLKNHTMNVADQDKLNFFINDWSSKDSVIQSVKLLSAIEMASNEDVFEIEENDEAIKILTRFNTAKCIVCDNDNFNRELLLKEKTAHRQVTMDSLTPEVKNALEKIIPLVPDKDPFKIKDRLLNSIAKGDSEAIQELCSDFEVYENFYDCSVENEIIKAFDESDYLNDFTEYQSLIEKKPDISDEDYLYIKEIIANNMSKPLTVERDEENNLRIYLSNEEFLGKNRDDLPLSAGEQNFLSLTFEFLKAKNSTCPIIVIDDPVSSFDSIYKNKIAYAIIKLLEGKEKIILTHNMDLIRLLDGQRKHCFKLYLINNTEGEVNGFVPLNDKEQEMLISLEKLLEAFRKDIPPNVCEPRLFLISMIPFMRSYAKITQPQESMADDLTQLMHGYKTEKVDIARAYTELFGNQEGFLPTSYEISVCDVLDKDVDGVNLIDDNAFPLLNRTLRHSFIYLSLRLKVEKALVEKFNLNIMESESLGDIIMKAYPDKNDPEQIRNRVRLTSKKTLLNEFNHFEDNLSIFQPAIDISDMSLKREQEDIEEFLKSL